MTNGISFIIVINTLCQSVQNEDTCIWFLFLM